MRLPTDSAAMRAFLDEVESSVTPMEYVRPTQKGLLVIAGMNDKGPFTHVRTGYDVTDEQAFQHPWQHDVKIANNATGISVHTADMVNCIFYHNGVQTIHVQDHGTSQPAFRGPGCGHHGHGLQFGRRGYGPGEDLQRLRDRCSGPAFHRGQDHVAQR